MAASNARLMKDYGVTHYAEETVATWRGGLSDHTRGIHFCTGATPEDLQALYSVIVKIVH